MKKIIWIVVLFLLILGVYYYIHSNTKNDSNWWDVLVWLNWSWGHEKFSWTFENICREWDMCPLQRDKELSWKITAISFESYMDGHDEIYIGDARIVLDAWGCRMIYPNSCAKYFTIKKLKNKIGRLDEWMYL